MKRILSLVMALFLVLGTASIFAVSAEEFVDTNFSIEIESVTYTEEDNPAAGDTISLEVYVQNLTDEDDLGSVECRLNYDSSKLKFVAAREKTGTGKKAVNHMAGYFGLFQSAAPDTNPAKNYIVNVGFENQKWDTDWDINNDIFFMVDFKVMGDWEGTTEISLSGQAQRRGDLAFYAGPDGTSNLVWGKGTVTRSEMLPTYTVDLSTEGEGSVTATVNGETVTGNEFSVKKGDVVTLMAGEGFKFWKNAKNNTILSTAPTLTVPVTRDMAFVAVFENAVEDETRLVYFKDSRTGKILKRMTVEYGYVLQESDFPEAAFKGYKLKGFRVGNVDAVGYVVDHLVEVYTIYQKDLSSSKLLTIYNGGRTSKTQRTFGEVVVVEARAKNFSYWTLDGKIISMDRVYRFNMPDRACDLVAAENKSIPEAVCATVDLSKEGQSFYYLMSRSLSEGNTLLETGVLMSRKATADDLTVDTANNTVTRGYSTADAEYDVVGFVKDATGKTGTWLVRGYITYETADGTIKTVYTDVSSIVIE